MNRELLIAYAMEYLSCLFRESRIKKIPLKSVFLFGSVARGDFDKDSDIDLFLDVDEKYSGILDGILKSVEKNFYRSESHKKFKLLGVGNAIKPLIGNLDKWELKESVEKDSIALYSSFSKGLIKYFLITIKPIKDIKKRNRVFRELLGRKEKHYKGTGIIQSVGGEQIETRVFMIPAEKVNTILKIFSKEKVDYKLLAVWK